MEHHQRFFCTSNRRTHRNLLNSTHLSNMLNADSRLAIAELVIYIVFFVTGLYMLIRHGKPGYLGWGYFLLFCILRLTSSGLQVNSTTVTGAIINSVGVSALLLTISGVLHEASAYASTHRPKVGWIIQLLLHLLVTSGIAISAIGASNLENATPAQRDTYRGMQEGGSLMLLLAVILLAVLAVTTLQSLQKTSLNSRRSSTNAAGTLTIGIIIALPFAAVRVIYSVVYAFSDSKTLSPITGSFAVKLILISLVQIFASLLLVIAGLSSRNVNAKRNTGMGEENMLADHPTRVRGFAGKH